VTPAARASLCLLLLALALVPAADGLVVANTDLTPAEVNLLFAMREYTLTYNEYAGRLPGWVTGPFENEKVNLYIESPDGVLVIGITFHGRKIVSFDAKGCPDPIVTVTTDRATVEEVMASDRPFDTFRAAMRNGTVTIEGNTLLGTLRSGMVRFGLQVMDVIGL
jgi:TPP-dependent 2-oxoacid decarboxylase